jgi:hypothetical protein
MVNVPFFIAAARIALVWKGDEVKSGTFVVGEAAPRVPSGA